jgi:cyclopropane-fatty-acyl-phospholipid synthase
LAGVENQIKRNKDCSETRASRRADFDLKIISKTRRKNTEREKGDTDGLPLGALFLMSVLARIRYGRITIQWMDGREFVYTGTETGPEGVLVIKDPACFRKMLTGGSLGFSEGYLDAGWDTPDLVALLDNLAQNVQGRRSSIRIPSPLKPVKRLVHSLRSNTTRGARKNISYHYDLGNDFYALWLDSTMTYSCAIFDQPDDELSDAQNNKYDHLLELAEVGPGDHVLEIGCGWGGFAVHAARKTGCHVTGLTISQEQYAWATELVKKGGLEDLVEIKLQDYRHVEGEFDKVVSIEMFEAVGERYWPVFFETIHDRLRPGGIAALQVITIKDESFDSYRKRPDFIQMHVFPGGMLPSVSRFREVADQAGLAMNEPALYGEHYVRTLSRWLDSFENAVAAGTTALPDDERFQRLWRYYLAYCIAGFRNGNINVMQTTLKADG